jgi:hypothetical protein
MDMNMQENMTRSASGIASGGRDAKRRRTDTLARNGIPIATASH